MQTDIPCGGCGESDAEKRCIGCLHDFSAPKQVPTEYATEFADFTKLDEE